MTSTSPMPLTSANDSKGLTMSRLPRLAYHYFPQASWLVLPAAVSDCLIYGYCGRAVSVVEQRWQPCSGTEGKTSHTHTHTHTHTLPFPWLTLYFHFSFMSRYIIVSSLYDDCRLLNSSHLSLLLRGCILVRQYIKNL
jgi:hypothetical protein